MDVLGNAIARRKALMSELYRVENFIETYQSLASGGEMPSPKTKRKFPSGKDDIRGRPAEAWRHIEGVLNDNVGRPMSRAEIVAGCAARGYQMPGRSPRDYVGIVLFRNKDKLLSEQPGKWQIRTSSAQIDEHQPLSAENETGSGT